MGQIADSVNTNSMRFGGDPTSPDGAASLIYDREGHRKYLTLGERQAFLKVAMQRPRDVRTFCLVLAYTGARLSEVLALTPSRIDPDAGIVVFESLKKRRRGVFRAVPLPPEVLAELNAVHHLTDRRRVPSAARQRIWTWCRTSAWDRVKSIMTAAAISGPQACPKGFRHAFAVASLQAGVPINLVRRWLGHARISTTEIYADVIGPEEQAIAGRFWATF
jgi:integrase/recombinase XerD